MPGGDDTLKRPEVGRGGEQCADNCESYLCENARIKVKVKARKAVYPLSRERLFGNCQLPGEEGGAGKWVMNAQMGR